MVPCCLQEKKLINTPPKTKSETTQRWEKIYSGGHCVQWSLRNIKGLVAFVRLIHTHAFRFIVIKRNGGGRLMRGISDRRNLGTWISGAGESRRVEFWRMMRRESQRGLEWRISAPMCARIPPPCAETLETPLKLKKVIYFRRVEFWRVDFWRL